MATPFSRKVIQDIIEKYKIIVEDVAERKCFSSQKIKVDNVTCAPPEIVYLPGSNTYGSYPGQKMEFNLRLERETVSAFLSDDQRTLNIAVNLGETLVKQVRSVTLMQGFKTHPVIKFDDFDIRVQLNHKRTYPFEDITYHISGTQIVLHIRLCERPKEDIDNMTSLRGNFARKEEERFRKQIPILENIRS